MGKGKALECGRGGSLPLVRSHGSRAALLTFRKFSYCSHSVVHNFYCCSVVTTVNNKNSVQRPTFTYSIPNFARWVRTRDGGDGPRPPLRRTVWTIRARPRSSLCRQRSGATSGIAIGRSCLKSLRRRRLKSRRYLSRENAS